MRPAILLLALVCGCDDLSIPINLTLGTEIYTGEAEAKAVLEEGAAILGYPVRYVDGSDGAITFSIHRIEKDANGNGKPDGSWLEGETLDDEACTRVGWSAPDPISIAHELGHTIARFEHEDDPDNLMHPESESPELYDWQLDLLERRLRRFNLCPKFER